MIYISVVNLVIVTAIFSHFNVAFSHLASITTTPGNGNTKSPKLLILVVDGFRWDYFKMHKDRLRGFQRFLHDGVQTEYVEPIFPSLSLPSWRTISTGLYPAYHNVLDNFMLRRADKENTEMTFSFKDNSSMNEMWWQFAEPIWITAVKAGHKVHVSNYSRCDVPFQGLLPTECTGFSNNHHQSFRLVDHLNTALLRFQQGYDLAMLYFDVIDNMGHDFGPNSENVAECLMEVDAALQEFMNNLDRKGGLREMLNMVITTDHGTTSVQVESGVKYIKLEHYVADLRDIYKVVGFGATLQIAAEEGKVDTDCLLSQVFNQILRMPGVDAYKKKDIPEELHFKESLFVHDILLVAHPKYLIVGLRGDKQIPNDPGAYTIGSKAGTHGYYNMSDMRGIFFANGPAFKKGVVHPPIGLEDQYQVFMHVLGIRPNAHNGTWGNVVGMFAS